MTNIKLTDDGDIDVTGNTLQFVSGQEEQQQIAKQRLQTFRGEWFLDTSIGIPYFQTIFRRNTDIALIDAIYIEEISNIPGFISLLEYNSVLDTETRELSLTWKARTVNGVINFDEVIT